MSATGGESNLRGADKQSEKDAFAKNEKPPPQAATPNLPPLPHELTAEWTVRAQLTFARAGEKVQREFNSNDPVNPVRVVYKWSTFDSPQPPDDYDVDIDIDNSSTSTMHTKPNSFASRASSQSMPLKVSKTNTSQQHNRRWQQAQQTQESFRSTTSSTNADFGGGDSAFSGSNTSKQRQRPYQRQTQSSTTGVGRNGLGVTTGTTSASTAAAVPLYGTRCRSTCNIVVSAVADFLPTDVTIAPSTMANQDIGSSGYDVGEEATTTPTRARATATDFVTTNEADPFVFNTAASYTVLPQKSIDSVTSAGSRNFATFGKVLDLRDAFSQTSDTETKYFKELERESEHRRYVNSRNPIDHRIQTDNHEMEKERMSSYEQRRVATERSANQKPYDNRFAGTDSYVDEGNSLTPSFLTSQSHTFKSASMSRIPTMPQQARTLQQQQQQMLASKQKSNSSEPLKKPRTVHIDVYCTGSELEEGDEDDEDGDNEGEDEGDNADADAESSSASSKTSEDDGNASKQHDMESNSTPQTVFDNDQMRLKHQRITGQVLPRRFQQQKQQPHQQTKPTSDQKSKQRPSDLNIGHAITKSSTAEEVSESKQLLFRKHIGDQRAAKLAALRQKYMRQPSDDAISSNYPNSSRSTVRDATCSSIASSMPTSTHADFEVYSSIKETEDPEEMYSLTKSDSFEYENSQDLLRIKQMERFWSRTTSLDESALGRQRQMSEGSSTNRAATHLQPISEITRHHNTLPSESENLSEASDIFYTYPGATTQRISPSHLQQTSHFLRNRPGFLQFFGPSVSPNPQQQPQQSHDASQSPIPEQLSAESLPRLQRWKSETRESADSISSHTHSRTDINMPLSPFQKAGSEAPPTTTTIAAFQPSPIHIRRFEIKHDSPAQSESLPIYPGYTAEHLMKATKFGQVIVSARKPGHHVGPTKNPNCSCDSCQRWLAERFQVRSRAFSLGERPILRRPT